MIKLNNEGYYCSKKVDFEDNNGHFVEKGFVVKYLIFLDEQKFLCSDWVNKDSINTDDISKIDRGGHYKIKDNLIKLVYQPGEWVKDCDLLSSTVLIHNFNNPGTKLIFQKDSVFLLKN